MRNIVFALLLSGCATAGMPSNATLAIKLQADEAVLQKIAADVAANCGPQFAPIAPVIAAILAVAANPTNALADITAAVQLVPELIADGKAVACVYATVTRGLKAAGFHAAADMGARVAELDIPNACTNGGTEGTCCKVANRRIPEYPVEQ